MSSSGPGLGEHLALVQLPARVRRSLRRFRKITGRTAVASVLTAAPESEAPSELSPPVHPQCAKKLRSVADAPCGEQWTIHLSAGRRSARTHDHTCPVGLRCSCVPIRLGGRLVGVAKLVVDARTPDASFRTSIDVLNLVVSEACKDSDVEILSDEVRALRQRVAELQQVRSVDPPRAEGLEIGTALVHRALAYLHRHYQDPALSLRSVAEALECNPKYLTSRFSRVVGEHMHTCLVALRISHACRLLVRTHEPVKAIAAASGFPRAGGMTSAFRSHVGVSPTEYRRIFAGP